MLINVLSITLCIGAITSVLAGTGQLNGECRNVIDCKDFGYFCSSNWTCQCLPGEYIPNNSRDACVGLINKKCKYDVDCLEGGYCKEQKKCMCKEGLFANEDSTECSSSSMASSPGTITFPVLLVLLMYLKFCDWLN